MIAFEEYLSTKGYKRFKLVRTLESELCDGKCLLVGASEQDHISTMRNMWYYWIRTDKNEFTADEFREKLAIIIGLSTGLTPTLLHPRLNATMEITEKDFYALHYKGEEGREDKIIKVGSDFDVTNVRLLSEFNFDEILDAIENNHTRKFYIPIKDN